MSESARILATEAITDARAALAQFAEAAERAMVGVDADINRVTQWLQQERPAHWKREVRARETAVLNAKTAIARKQIIAAPEPASVVDERRALQRAQRRLDEARRRQEATHRWAVSWERQSTAYKGPAHQIREFSSGRIPGAIAALTKMVESIEAYLAVAPPESPPPTAEPPPASGVSSSSDPATGGAP